MERERPAWREPMVWLITALPLTSVVAGAWLLLAAIHSGGDDAIADTVQQTGQIQLSDIGPDAGATRDGLSAVLRVGDGSIEVFPATGEFDRRAVLELSLRHPTLANADQQLRLQPTPNGWSAHANLDAGHDWKLQLGPPGMHWRIVGRLPRGMHATRLAPALQ